MNPEKRKKNEIKFQDWENLENNGRRYFLIIKGRKGWYARYVKETDMEENTVRFYQEIYNDKNQLTEIHEKYPVDKGHKKVTT